jgi:hypothetical protein
VIDAQDAGMRDVVCDRLAEVAVAVFPHRVRIERREAPVLPFGEEEVRRRTDGHPLREYMRVLMRVIPARIHAEGKVEVEAGAETARRVGDFAHLLG